MIPMSNSTAFAAASVAPNVDISKKPRESPFIPKFPTIPESDDWSGLDDDDGLKYDLIRTYLKTKVDWTLDYLILPNICFYQVNKSRFKQLMDDKSSFVQLVNRKEIVDGLIEKFKNMDSLYLYGPSGCGKSFIIYQIACQLMREDDTIVIYVNRASPAVITDILQMLKTRYFCCFII
jgi:hypothetical protein